MGKSVTVRPGFNYFRGPSPTGYRAYNPGATVVYTDAEYAALTATDTRAITSPPTTVADPVRPSVDSFSRAVNVVAAATGTFNAKLGPNRVTLTGNVTLVMPTGVANGNRSTVDLFLTQDATGSCLATFPASVKFAGGTAVVLSTGANKLDYIQLQTIDGGVSWYVTEKQLDLR